MDSQHISNSYLTNSTGLITLLDVPFSTRSDVEKKVILKRGRPTPKVSIVKIYNNRSRSFQSSWYDQHKWLCGCEEKSKLFCWPCLLLSTKKTIWSTEGFDDLKNLSRSVAKHASTKDHLHAHLSLNNLSNKVFKINQLLNEDNGLQKIRYNEEVKKNREIFKIFVDVTSLICNQGLVYSEHIGSEDLINRENFQEIFNLVITRTPELKQHWDNMNFDKGLSKTIQNELIECLQVELIKVIERDIHQAPFFACMIDETTNISEKTQFSIVVRLVDSNAEILEYFLGFYDFNGKADGVFSVLCNALKRFNMEEKLVSQTYDGCSVTPGELNGLQAKVREIAPQAILTHRLAHHLNLVLQQSCSKIKTVNVFFSVLQGIPGYFHRSSKRTAVLENVLGKRVPTNSEVRWNSNSKIISSFHTNRLVFIKVFRELLKSSDAVTVREAQGYLNNLNDFTFVFLLSLFQNIFEQAGLLFKTLRTFSNDTQLFYNSVVDCISYVRKLRDDKKYDELIRLTESTTGCRSVMIHDQFANTDIDPSTYHKQIYFEILDNIVTQLETRFSKYEELSFLELGETKNFAHYSKEFPNDAFTCLINTYGEHFNKEKLRTELETIFSFNDNDTFHSLSINKLVKQMATDGTKEIVPEAFKLFALIATIPASSASAERSNLSCIQRIKSYSKNSQDGIGDFALISIEKDTIKKLHCTTSWYDDVIDRFAMKKVCQVNLLYKKLDNQTSSTVRQSFPSLKNMRHKNKPETGNTSKQAEKTFVSDVIKAEPLEIIDYYGQQDDDAQVDPLQLDNQSDSELTKSDSDTDTLDSSIKSKPVDNEEQLDKNYIDEDKAFLLSLLPAMRELNGEQKMQFKMMILEQLRKLRYPNIEPSRNLTVLSVQNLNSAVPTPVVLPSLHIEDVTAHTGQTAPTIISRKKARPASCFPETTSKTVKPRKQQPKSKPGPAPKRQKLDRPGTKKAAANPIRIRPIPQQDLMKPTGVRTATHIEEPRLAPTTAAGTQQTYDSPTSSTQLRDEYRTHTPTNNANEPLETEIDVEEIKLEYIKVEPFIEFDSGDTET